jgi:hypothetical protein
MDADQQKQLRAPFDAGAIGKLPRVWCYQCREAIKAKRHNCDQHQRTQCRECGNNMTTAHLHLDYIGHAAVTDRLLSVDPSWTWEPVAIGTDGLPVLDRNGGLWIRLTVAGVTRLGYGDAEGKQGGSAVKEAIGDALRNASMRFGVALDLWHKGDLHAGDDEPAAQQERPSAPQQRTNGQQQSDQLAAVDGPAEAARAELRRKVKEAGIDGKALAAKFKEQYGEELTACTNAARINAFAKLQNLSSASRVAANNGAAK